MESFLATETLIIELLLVVSLVALAVRRLRVPYTVGLVIAGLLLTFGQKLQFDLTPDLILFLFVPPLVFEAAFHLDYKHLRENLPNILVLAVPGVLLTMLIVGLIVSYGTGLSRSTALVFGALIAATDPVAVVALFRQLGAPKKLTVLIEGESLFNDGTAIVVFQLMLAVVVSASAVTTAAQTINGHSPISFDLLATTIDFVRVSIGGAGIGFGLGWVVSQIIARIDDYLIETTLTTILAFGSFLVAEELHVSGVLAVVVAGIVCGNTGFRRMSPTTRIVLVNFWEYLAFIANSIVFLLIGLAVNVRQLITYIFPITIAILATLISRAIVIYTLTWLTNRARKTPFAVTGKYQHVLFWGGLRGAISLALVLSLPASFADRDVLRVMTYGIVLFTLLVQGTTMQFLLRRLKLTVTDDNQLEYERRQGRLLATRAAQERLTGMHAAGLISTVTWKRLAPEIESKLQDHLAAQHDLLEAQPALHIAELADARSEGLRAERTALTKLLGDGTISETVYEELVANVDAQIEQTRTPDEMPEHSSGN